MKLKGFTVINLLLVLVLFEYADCKILNRLLKRIHKKKCSFLELLGTSCYNKVRKPCTKNYASIAKENDDLRTQIQLLKKLKEQEKQNKLESFKSGNNKGELVAESTTTIASISTDYEFQSQTEKENANRNIVEKETHTTQENRWGTPQINIFHIVHEGVKNKNGCNKLQDDSDSSNIGIQLKGGNFGNQEINIIQKMTKNKQEGNLGYSNQVITQNKNKKQQQFNENQWEYNGIQFQGDVSGNKNQVIKQTKHKNQKEFNKNEGDNGIRNQGSDFGFQVSTQNGNKNQQEQNENAWSDGGDGGNNNQFSTQNGNKNQQELNEKELGNNGIQYLVDVFGNIDQIIKKTKNKSQIEFNENEGDNGIRNQGSDFGFQGSTQNGNKNQQELNEKEWGNNGIQSQGSNFDNQASMQNGNKKKEELNTMGGNGILAIGGYSGITNIAQKDYENHKEVGEAQHANCNQNGFSQTSEAHIHHHHYSNTFFVRSSNSNTHITNQKIKI